MNAHRRLCGVTLMLVLFMTVGCGEDSSTSSSDLSRGDVDARQRLLIAYRVAEKARRDRVQCTIDPGSDCDPLAYPTPDALVPEIGTAKLHRLVIRLATTTDRVVEPRSTYVVSEGTKGHSIMLAERTPAGTIWVLDGSPSGHRITELTDSGE